MTLLPFEMDAALWLRVKAAFEAALDQRPEDRLVWLRRRERDDRVVAEALSLLDAHDRADAFIETPALCLPDSLEALREVIPFDRGAAVPIGARLRAYEIVAHLGDGGMGSVFLGKRIDAAFDQQVAIKLVRADVATPALADRLRRERRILAALDHPNIARLIDGGSTESGVPYAVMEYVDGVPIDQYCDAAELTVRQRVQLFSTVCSAVQYAHQHLVIHRDLKPSNIIVTRDGVPKLLDFGIAKLIEPIASAADETRTGWRALTLETASPEQVRGRTITIASDIYTLGVLLYRLLSGVSPYRLSTPDRVALEHAICEVEPPAPSQIAPPDRRRQLAGDLDLIVLKALQKDPARRYASVAQLADDLQRQLEGRPVSAAPDAWTYRARKFVKRHRVGVAATATGLLALMAGGATTVYQARVADRQRELAERRSNDVRRLANAFLFEFPNAIKDQVGSTQARTQAVTRAIDYLDGLAADSAQDPQLARELTGAYLQLGDVLGNPYFANLGDPVRARSSYEKALDKSEALTRRPDAQAADWLLLARTQMALGDVRWAGANNAEALTHYRAAIAIVEGEHVTRAAPETTPLQARLHYMVGQVLLKSGRSLEAIPSFERAIALNETCAAPPAGLTECRRQLSVSYMKLGDTFRLVGDDARAMVESQRASDLVHQLADAQPQRRDLRRLVGMLDMRLSSDMAATGHGPKASALAARALSVTEALAQSDPSDVQAEGDYAFALRTRGEISLVLGDLTSSEHYLTKAMDILERLRPKQALFEYQAEFALCLSRLARVADRTGRPDLAIADRLKALPVLETFGRESEVPYELVSIYEELGDNYMARARRPGVPEAARKADLAAAAQYFDKSVQASSDVAAWGDVPPLKAAQVQRVVLKRDRARPTGG